MPKRYRPQPRKTLKGQLRELVRWIDTPGAWTKEYEARDKDGHSVLAKSTKAYCWCIHGVTRLISPSDQGKSLDEELRIQCGVAWLPGVNDGPRGRIRIRSAIRKLAKQHGAL